MIRIPYFEAGAGHILLSVSGAEQLSGILAEALASLRHALDANPENPSPGADEVRVDLQCGLVSVTIVTDLSMHKRAAIRDDHEWVDAFTMEPKTVVTPDWWDNLNSTIEEPGLD